MLSGIKDNNFCNVIDVPFIKKCINADANIELVILTTNANTNPNTAAYKNCCDLNALFQIIILL